MYDESHRLDIEVGEAKAVFRLSAFVAGSWVLLSTIEAQFGEFFWVRVAEAIRVLSSGSVKFALEDQFVAGALLVGLPGADRLLQSGGDDVVLPGPTRAKKVGGSGSRVKPKPEVFRDEVILSDDVDVLDHLIADGS